MTYQNRYKTSPRKDSVQVGLEFQDYVLETLAKELGFVIQVFSSAEKQLTGESIQAFEFKYDERCTDTKRISLECYEKSNANNKQWVPSGILREDNTIFYVQGNKHRFYLFFKQHLRSYLNRYKPRLDEKYGTIKTFYMPFQVADFWGVCFPRENELQITLPF